MARRITTWNLKGRSRPELEDVASHLQETASDVVVLQEVQRRQAQALADLLGWTATWRRKHWPVVVPAEGLAVLTPMPPERVRTAVLAARFRLWSPRRRIAVAVDVDGLCVVDVHLGSGVSDGERARQAARTIDLVGEGPSVVAGDLNTRPGSVVLRTFTAVGFVDAWDRCRPGEPGPTNWPAGPREGVPRSRLDYVLVSPSLLAVEATLPSELGRFAALSDHLPLTVDVIPVGLGGDRS